MSRRRFLPPSNMSKSTAWATERSTTGSVTPYSAVRGTGASRSLSTTRTVSLLRFLTRPCRSVCRKSTSSSRPRTENHLLQGQRTGLMKAILSKQARCLVSQVPAPTISGTWIRPIPRLWSTARPMSTGAMSTSTSVVLSTLPATSSIPASGTSSSMTWAMSARTSRSAN